MTELEKCMAGEDYNCHDQIFLDFKGRARKLLQEYNTLAYEQKEEKEEILKELFGEIGTKVSVASPFICDYGRNIFMGNNVSVNMNCTFVDCNKIIIGDNVLIASNVQLYTAAHPVELAERYVQSASPAYLRIANKNWERLLVRGRCYCPSGRNNRRRFRYRGRKRCHERYTGKLIGSGQPLPRNTED